MKHGISLGRIGGGALATIALVGLLIVAGGRSAQAWGWHEWNDRIVGVWSVDVTLQNCQTGAPIGVPFKSLVTYHEGGTISEVTSAPAFAVGQRTPATGSWDRRRGRTYEIHMIGLILFDTPPNLPVTPGFSAGWNTVTHTGEFIDANHFTSSGANEFVKQNGDVYRAGCSTAVGQRVE